MGAGQTVKCPLVDFPVSSHSPAMLMMLLTGLGHFPMLSW